MSLNAVSSSTVGIASNLYIVRSRDAAIRTKREVFSAAIAEAKTSRLNDLLGAAIVELDVTAAVISH